MSKAEKRILSQILNLFADVREQKDAFYTQPSSQEDIQRMKTQWRASSEANKRISSDMTRRRANAKSGSN